MLVVIINLIYLILYPPQVCKAQENELKKLVIGVPTISSSDIDFFKKLVITICSKLEIEAEIFQSPAIRSLKMLGDGKLDAEGPRNSSIENEYPDLIRVPEIFYTTELSAFTINPDIHISDWESLKPYKVAYPKGWKLFVENVSHYKSLEVLHSQKALFDFLLSGRADIILAKKKDGQEIITEKDCKGIYIIEQPIVTSKQFLYLHKRTKDLATVIAKTLREMKKDGSYQKMYAEYNY